MSFTPPDRDHGAGLFETLLARDGRIQALGAHLGRLARSARELYGASLPTGLSGDLRHGVHAFAGARRLRVDARPGDGGLALAITTSDVPESPHATVRCQVVEVPGGLGRHKLADRRRLDELGARTGPGLTVLIADRAGELLEAAWGNLLLIEGKHLITPPADGRLLPGVTRRLALQLARSLGLDPRQEPVSLDRARRADGILLTSALRHCVPATLEHGGPDSARAERVAARVRAALERMAWE